MSSRAEHNKLPEIHVWNAQPELPVIQWRGDPYRTSAELAGDIRWLRQYAAMSPLRWRWLSRVGDYLWDTLSIHEIEELLDYREYWGRIDSTLKGMGKGINAAWIIHPLYRRFIVYNLVDE